MNKITLAKSLGKATGVMTVAFVGTVAIAFQASAAEILVGTSSASFADQPSGSRPVLTLNKYNGDKTLTRVLVIIDKDNTNFTSQGSVSNTGATAEYVEIETRVRTCEIIPQPGAPAVLTKLIPFSTNQLIGLQTYPNLASGASESFGPYIIYGTDSNTYTTGLNDFVGSGTFSFVPFILTSLIKTTTAIDTEKIKPSIQTIADARITVNYYAQIDPPVTSEPNKLLHLWLFGSLGIAYNLRKNKAKQRY